MLLFAICSYASVQKIKNWIT